MEEQLLVPEVAQEVVDIVLSEAMVVLTLVVMVVQEQM